MVSGKTQMFLNSQKNGEEAAADENKSKRLLALVEIGIPEDEQNESLPIRIDRQKHHFALLHGHGDLDNVFTFYVIQLASVCFSRYLAEFPYRFLDRFYLYLVSDLNKF